MIERIQELESAAFDAWPADEVLTLGGWRLRFNHGVTHRANSVWTIAWDGTFPLDRVLDRVETMYAERGLPAQLQITAAALPASLDDALAHRGYEARLGTEVWTTPLSRLAPDEAPREIEVRCSTDLDEEWFDLSGRRGRFRGEEIPVYRRMMERLVGRAGFVIARRDGVPAATGLVVASVGRVGVFAMRTLEEHRQQGLARAVLAAIGSFAAARDAAELYLQVETDNEPALALYAQCGFRREYGYHYRRAPTR